MCREKVTILGTHTVKPAGVQAHSAPLHMTAWDQLFGAQHNKAVFFYNPPTASLKDMVDTLKDSLGRALAQFSPFAGRIRRAHDDRRRLEILCNGEGAELVEAECDGEMSSFRDYTDLEKVMALLPGTDPDRPVEETPTLMLQITRFRCGGVALGHSTAHLAADGHAAYHFFSEWARLARGEAMKEAPSLLYRSIFQEREIWPNNGRQRTFSDHIEFRNPPLMLGKQDAIDEWKKETVNLALPVTKDHLDALKKAASSTATLNNGQGISLSFSRFVVLAAHIWRCLCKARRHEHHQQTTLSFTANVRNLIHTIRLPRATFGNMVVSTRAISQSGDLISNDLGFACVKLSDAIKMVDEDYVLSHFELLEKQDDLSLLMKDNSVFSKTPKEGKPYYGNPNLKVVSWLSMPLHGLDFGWGDSVGIIPLVLEFDGAMIFLPSPDNDGSIVVLLCLQAAHVEDFKTYFYQDIAKY